ncbi:MAG: Crp/Fnr family transcriptional regulator, partial [Saprospiraceae bacterium]|nr:Crp/Fnr family transcriptional regulator [Saprospiraceae bacterium]
MKNKTCPITNTDASEVSHGCMNCLIRKLSLFEGLDLEQLHMLNSLRSDVLFGSDEVIYRQGLKPIGLLCLSSGKVKIVKNNINGSELIVTLKRPGDFLGFYDLMREDVHASSAIALEESTICVIPEQIFRDVLRSSLSLSLKINKFLADELIKSGQRTAALTQKYMRARLADALLY